MSSVASMTEINESIEHTLAVWRRRFLWALAVLVLLAGAAAAAGLIWYERFQHHVNQQEMSREVVHTTFEAPVRGNVRIELHLYQQANARAQPLVIFTSGDGGWSPFCADVAAHIAATGRAVVGFNIKDYLVTFATSQRPVAPNELARDYDSIVKESAVQPGIDARNGL